MMMAMVKTTKTKWSLIKKAFNDASTKASDNIRTLSLAGIATIWVFKQEKKVDQSTVYEIDNLLAIAAAFIVLTLSRDLLQYLYKTIAWHLCKLKVYKLSTQPEDNTTIEVWDSINLPVSIIFYAKCFVLVCAYTFILLYIWSVIKFV
jgi:hypothetical protein